jgi:integrase
MAATTKSRNGGIYENAPGKLTVTMYDRNAKGKKRHVGTVYYPPQERRPHNWYPTKAKAERAARKMKDEAEEQRDRERLGSAAETIRSFATRWPQNYTKRRSVRTLNHNSERIQALVRDFGERPLRDGISKVEARAWIEGGSVPPSVRAAARNWHGAKVLPGGDIEVPEHTGNHLAVRAMFNDALKDDLIASNPFAALNVSEKPGRRGNAITILKQAELSLLVDTAYDLLGPSYGRHYGALLQVAAWTGLRPGELWALQIDDAPGRNRVDLAAGEIHVDWQLRDDGTVGRPKWGSVRTVFILPPARTALELAIGERKESGGPVFLTARGLPFSNSGNVYYWHRVRLAFWNALPASRRSKLRRADGGPEPGKIPIDFDFYEMRHLFGTILAEMRQSPPAIADQMGHKDGGVLALNRYIHVRSESVRRDLLEGWDEWQRRQDQDERKRAAGE